MKKIKKGTILVVDDSRVSQTHLVQILQDEYIIHAASGGVEAIQIAKAAVPDLILLDIVMPQMDGYETIGALRENEKTKDIPVIFITSLDQGSDEEKGLLLGAVDYITKPYNPTIVKLRISIQLKIVEQIRTINDLGMMDVTTRLPNRRYFAKRLAEEWQRAVSEKQKRQLGILMIDIDKLRAFNAIYGYNHGDACLATVAGIISENALLSPGDIAARWAYGSFAVLILNATAAECRAIGENIRQAVETTPIVGPTCEKANVTTSIGAISISPDSHDYSVEQFISNADSALYLAKELGRNQVVVQS
ncbi:MAG: diguanylate cyclase [Clostridiales bacterium]|jgi:diguanylate cyclase (GGDEF)-like protein|nr:diguanylate cyclase [Clostridiales bacterium]